LAVLSAPPAFTIPANLILAQRYGFRHPIGGRGTPSATRCGAARRQVRLWRPR
jgi:hypothetical protein